MNKLNCVFVSVDIAGAVVVVAIISLLYLKMSAKWSVNSLLLFLFLICDFADSNLFWLNGYSAATTTATANISILINQISRWLHIIYRLQ